MPIQRSTRPKKLAVTGIASSRSPWMIGDADRQDARGTPSVKLNFAPYQGTRSPSNHVVPICCRLATIVSPLPCSKHLLTPPKCVFGPFLGWQNEQDRRRGS